MNYHALVDAYSYVAMLSKSIKELSDRKCSYVFEKKWRVQKGQMCCNKSYKQYLRDVWEAHTVAIGFYIAK